MKSSRRATFVAVLCVAEILLLAGIWKGITGQIRDMNQAVNDISDLKDPSPFRVALLGHLGKIRLGLQGFLRSGDTSLVDQVTQSRKDFELALPEFEKQNPQLLPRAATEEIQRSFGIYNEAIGHTLDANGKRIQNRSVLDQNFVRILYLIDHEIRPLLRKSQAEGEERKEAILNVENQARAWQQNLAKAWAQPSHSATELALENDSRGESYLSRYGRMELLARERKIQKEIVQLWQSNGDLSRESFALEQVVAEAESFMETQRIQVVQALTKYLPAMPPSELQARKQSYVSRIRWHGALACVLALIGLVSLRFAGFGTLRAWRGQPLWPSIRIKSSFNEQPAPIVKDSIIQMDLKGTITHWTPQAEALYGYLSAEMLGQSISKLFDSESEISRLYKNLVESPQTSFETIHRAKEGLAIPVRIEFRPVVNSTGKATAIGLLCTRR